jgi:flagellar biogenesis protein FliO
MYLAEVPNIIAFGSTSWLDYFKTLLVLGGVCALAMCAVRVWGQKLKRTTRSPSGPVYVLARCPLEPKRSLYLVRAGKCAVLLGSSESGIQFMTTLDPKDFVEDSIVDGPNLRERNCFAQLLRSFSLRRESNTL